MKTPVWLRPDQGHLWNYEQRHKKSHRSWRSKLSMALPPSSPSPERSIKLRVYIGSHFDETAPLEPSVHR